MKEEASTANDPRMPSAAKPYVSPTISPQDLPIDYAGFLAVIFGVFGVIFHVSNFFPISPSLKYHLRPSTDPSPVGSDLASLQFYQYTLYLTDWNPNHTFTLRP